jgi:hypothetical protein
MASVAEGLSVEPLLGIGRDAEDPDVNCERRTTLRLPLEWSVYVARACGTHPLHSKTRNLSSSGFYCILNERLAPGEHIECDLVVPTHISRSCEDVLFLRCKAQVVRVERMDAGEGYGFACRIEDYRLIHSADDEAPRDSALDRCS